MRQLDLLVILLLIPLFAVIANMMTPAATGETEPHAWGAGYQWGAGQWATNQSRLTRSRIVRGTKVPPGQHPYLPETTKLLQNDNLIPTLNRTYAMNLEAETGHLFPYADAVLMPPPPPPPRRFVRRKEPVRVPHLKIQSYSQSNQ